MIEALTATPTRPPATFVAPLFEPLSDTSKRYSNWYLPALQPGNCRSPLHRPRHGQDPRAQRLPEAGRADRRQSILRANELGLL